MCVFKIKKETTFYFTDNQAVVDLICANRIAHIGANRIAHICGAEMMKIDVQGTQRYAHHVHDFAYIGANFKTLSYGSPSV